MTHGQVLRGQGWTGRASVQAAWQQAGGDPATSLHLLRWPWPEADQPPQTCAAWALPPRVATQTLRLSCPVPSRRRSCWAAPVVSTSYKNSSSSVPPAPLWDAPWRIPSAPEQDGSGPWGTSWEGQGQAPTPRPSAPSDWWPGACLAEGTRPPPVMKPRWPRVAPEEGWPFWSHQVPRGPRPRSMASCPPPLARDGDHRAGRHPHPCHQPGRHVLSSGVSEASRFAYLQTATPLLPLTSPDAHQDFLGSAHPRASALPTSGPWLLRG